MADELSSHQTQTSPQMQTSSQKRSDSDTTEPSEAVTAVIDPPGPVPEVPVPEVPVPAGPAPVGPDPAGGPLSGEGASGGGGPGGDGPGGGAPHGESPGGTPPGDTPRRRLRRDMEHRILGGVAAGVARYLDIDVAIVRIAFAVLTVLGGSGALIYVAAWLLIPADDEDHPVAQLWAGRRPPRRSLVVIALGVVIGVIALSDLWSNGLWWPHPDGGVGFGLGAVALVLAVALVAGSGANRTAASRLRWLALTVLLAIVAVMVVAAATVFSIEAASGVPLRGGIGDTQWHPTSAGQVASNYRLAVGNLNVDLSDVHFRSGTTHVTASVGVGRLVVEVPPGPTVSVVAHSGLGDVEVFGQHDGGLSTVQSVQSDGVGTGSRAHVLLNADAGVGQVQVVRTISALS